MLFSQKNNYVLVYLVLLFFHFVQLYNYFEDANYVYLILEMCHNGEINRYLKKTGKPVSENEGTNHICAALIHNNDFYGT